MTYTIVNAPVDELWKFIEVSGSVFKQAMKDMSNMLLIKRKGTELALFITDKNCYLPYNMNIFGYRGPAMITGYQDGKPCSLSEHDMAVAEEYLDVCSEYAEKYMRETI